MTAEWHFLVVDDQPIMRYIVIAMLNMLGYNNVSEAENGEQALQLLQSSDDCDTPINFMITDWNMPVMNGLVLLRTIRARNDLQHLPVLMVTSEAETAHMLAATQAGVDGYMNKVSLKIKTLHQALEKIMNNRGLAA